MDKVTFVGLDAKTGSVFSFFFKFCIFYKYINYVKDRPLS